MKSRVVVADDHTVVSEGVRGILERMGCQVVASVLDGRALISAVSELKPDLVVLDVSMPILNGIEAARRIRTQNRRVKLIVLSMHTDPVYVREAFRVGANAYVVKSAAVSELGKAVEEVMQGRNYMTSRVNGSQLNAFLSGPPSKSFGNELTERQREVLQLVAEGKTGKEIAEVLRISLKTVEFHKARLMDVLGLHTTAELTRYAVEHKIVGV
ncbi:MAG: response regulator transcription factor [Acidobacteriaceae bacterium]|nr:response regulator transcription factor [Acidobacteriaceae bacterium]